MSLGVGWMLKCLRTLTAWSLAFSEQSRDRQRPSPTCERSYEYKRIEAAHVKCIIVLSLHLEAVIPDFDLVLTL